MCSLPREKDEHRLQVFITLISRERGWKRKLKRNRAARCWLASRGMSRSPWPVIEAARFQLTVCDLKFASVPSVNSCYFRTLWTAQAAFQRTQSRPLTWITLFMLYHITHTTMAAAFCRLLKTGSRSSAASCAQLQARKLGYPYLYIYPLVIHSTFHPLVIHSTIHQLSHHGFCVFYACTGR